MENKTDEQKNRDLFLWLNPGGCWHEQADRRGRAYNSPYCKHCKVVGYGEFSNPRYHEWGGLRALFVALEDKAFDIHITSFEADGQRRYRAAINKQHFSSFADSLPMALREAAVKAMEAEKTK